MDNTQIDTIGKSLQSIKDKLATGTSLASNIVYTEANRLYDKQQSIHDAQFGQDRMIYLNQTQVKRTAAFTKVWILTIVSLGVILLFRMFGSFMPEPILALIYIFLISICVFYALYVYTDVSGREVTNFDRFNIPAPVTNLSADQIAANKKNAINTGDLLGTNATTGVCSGQACCSYTEAYDTTLNKCSACPADRPYYLVDQQACGGCASTDNYVKATQLCMQEPTGATYDTSNLTYVCATGQTYDAGSNTCA